jgi:hypothetical protein
VRNHKNATISAVSYCDDCPAGFGGMSCQEKVHGSARTPSESQHGLVLNETLVTYLSLGIVLLATGIASTLFIVLRRQSNGVFYKTVQATEDVEHDEAASTTGSDDLPKQEKWRNVV